MAIFSHQKRLVVRLRTELTFQVAIFIPENYSFRGNVMKANSSVMHSVVAPTLSRPAKAVKR